MRRIVVLAAVVLIGCGDRGPDKARATDPRMTGTAAGRGLSAPPSWFSDATESSKLRMTHFNGMAGDFLYPEVMAPGVALFDYDNDGDLDVFVPQGRMLGIKTQDQALVKPEQPLHGHLFRNDLDIGRGVSAAPGVASPANVPPPPPPNRLPFPVW